MKRLITLASVIVLAAAYYGAASPPCNGSFCCWLATANEPACPTPCQRSDYVYAATSNPAIVGVYFSSNNSCELAWQASTWIYVDVNWTAYIYSGGDCTGTVEKSGTEPNLNKTLKFNAFCSS